jgi:hypothetical protein
MKAQKQINLYSVKGASRFDQSIQSKKTDRTGETQTRSLST